ncbi:MAG: cobalamin B12-binding domain-containing protein, partial [bacterium]|nr:cobalamin B12-binding domain-containing protein [bacterium]
MAKVILIDPPNGGIQNVRPQLWALHLAAMILDGGLDGVEVEILDCTVDKEAHKKLITLLQKEKIICVGITALIGSILTGALEIAATVRKYTPRVPIVWGGAHPTTVPGSILSHALADVICIGEGEESFVQ